MLRPCTLSTASQLSSASCLGATPRQAPKRLPCWSMWTLGPLSSDLCTPTAGEHDPNAALLPFWFHTKAALLCFHTKAVSGSRCSYCIQAQPQYCFDSTPRQHQRHNGHIADEHNHTAALDSYQGCIRDTVARVYHSSG